MFREVARKVTDYSDSSEEIMIWSPIQVTGNGWQGSRSFLSLKRKLNAENSEMAALFRAPVHRHWEVRNQPIQGPR
jgi:hypothetical protein